MLLDVIDALVARVIRPGEVLAIWSSRLFRTEDVLYMEVDATVLGRTGKSLVIQENSKANDVRILALPKFAVDLFMRILGDLEPNEWDVVFPSSADTLMDPGNLRHAWIKTFAGAEF